MPEQVATGRGRDAVAFVSGAERAVNERDLEATVGVYAADADLSVVTDGALEDHRGSEAILHAWSAYLRVFAARGFHLQKTIVAANDGIVVNTWTGTLGGRTEAQGIEVWRFDDSGRVRQHRMYSFLNVKPSTSLLARARLALAYPLTALALLRETRRG